MTDLPVLKIGIVILTLLLAGCQPSVFQSKEMKLPATGANISEISWVKMNVTESPADYGLAEGGRYCIENPNRSKNVHCDTLKLNDGRVFKINCWDDLMANLICFNESEVENLTRSKW